MSRIDSKLKPMEQTRDVNDADSDDSYEDDSEFSSEENGAKSKVFKKSNIVSGFSMKDTGQINQFQGYKGKKHSQSAGTHIHKAKLVVSNSVSKKEYGLDTEVLRVSFNVILVRMSPGLKDTFLTLGKQIHDEYEKRELKEKEWKLHGNGYFINFEKGYEVCLINEDMIYEGVTFVTAENIVQPDKKGILMDQFGVYEGEFKKGVAQGQGKYIDKSTMAEYEGMWANGIMTEGIIKNKKFKFRGTFENGVANGAGAIIFKESKSKYMGGFLNGEYHSMNVQAYYKTKDYNYKGQFQHGKKEGRGVLTEYDKLKVAKNAKFRPADQYDGEWMDDYYVTKRKVRELRKLDAEAGQQMMEDLMMFVQENKIDGNSMSDYSSTIKGSEVTKMYKYQRKSESKIKEKQQIPYYEKQSVDGRSYMSGRSGKSLGMGKGKTVETTPSEINIPEAFEEDDDSESEL